MHLSALKSQSVHYTYGSSNETKLRYDTFILKKKAKKSVNIKDVMLLIGKYFSDFADATCFFLFWFYILKITWKISILRKYSFQNWISISVYTDVLKTIYSFKPVQRVVCLQAQRMTFQLTINSRVITPVIFLAIMYHCM